MSDAADDADFEITKTIERALELRPKLPAAEYNFYGNKICIDCGEEIPEKRAELPFVVRCISCQEIEERA